VGSGCNQWSTVGVGSEFFGCFEVGDYEKNIIYEYILYQIAEFIKSIEREWSISKMVGITAVSVESME